MVNRWRSYRGVQGTFNACGGGVRREWLHSVFATSNETGKPTCEGDISPAFDAGEMSPGIVELITSEAAQRARMDVQGD
jgi:hypothetical protein